MRLPSGKGGGPNEPDAERFQIWNVQRAAAAVVDLAIGDHSAI
jgi:hypothetical protein